MRVSVLILSFVIMSSSLAIDIQYYSFGRGRDVQYHPKEVPFLNLLLPEFQIVYHVKPTIAWHELIESA